MGNKKDKKTVWIYAVVLFTSAFIVLMITAYSQIKVNQSIDDVKDKLGDTEKEKSNFQINLSSALAENKKLNEKIQILEKEIEDARIRESNAKKELRNIEDESVLKTKYFQKLMKANIKYDNGDVKSCSLILLRDIDKDYIDGNALIMYEKLFEKSSKKASLEFYNDGYSYYIDDDYDKAIGSFKNSIILAVDDYYSDDCYYFLGYSYFKKGNIHDAKETMNLLLTNYPNSTYKKDVKDFLKLLID